MKLYPWMLTNFRLGLMESKKGSSNTTVKIKMGRNPTNPLNVGSVASRAICKKIATPIKNKSNWHVLKLLIVEVKMSRKTDAGVGTVSCSNSIGLT